MIRQLLWYRNVQQYIILVRWSRFYTLKNLSLLFLFSLALFLFPLLPKLTQIPYAFAQGDSVTVQITGPTQPPGFAPALLTLHVNDTIVFVNQSSPPASFAVSAADGSFSSPAIAPGAQWTVTFNTIGAHEYHEAASANSGRMVGEILVVSNTVSLLPTPYPEAEATVLAAIEAGKSPPDTIVLPTPTAALDKQPKSTSSPASPLPWILLVLVLALGAGAGFMFYRRRRARLRKETEELAEAETRPLTSPTPSHPPAQPAQAEKKVKMLTLAGLFRRRKRDDEDEDDLDLENYEDV